ncbi:cation diffusion facilitator family transporter [soil metagenome]
MVNAALTVRPFRDRAFNGKAGRAAFDPIGKTQGFRDKGAMTSPVETPPEAASETTPLTCADAAAVTRRITRLSVGAAVVLIALKAFALGASGSVSILASLTDSALDLAASLATFYAVRWAAAPPDADHRHGHGKGEAMAGLVQSGLIFASAVFVGWEAIHRIFDPRPVSAGGWALAVIVISMGLTAALVWYQTQALKKVNSLAVAGDRAHYAADLAAAGVVLIGVVSGAWLHAPGLDAAAGLVVAIWLAWGALGLLKTASTQLLDGSAKDEDIAAITRAVLADPRIRGVHRLRTRMSGSATMVQMHVDLDPKLTLAVAHQILDEAEARILAVVPGADVMMHPDPVSPVGTTGPWG